MSMKLLLGSSTDDDNDSSEKQENLGHEKNKISKRQTQ
jgi:hypothetical protein